VRADSKLKTQNSKLARLVPLLLRWFTDNARDLPWRRTCDPHAIWVSEIMLQQTQVKTVLPYWKRWMRELPTIKAVAKASPDKIHKLWEGLGYYTRARNLQKAAKEIVAKHDGRFPENYDDVLALQGIGRYTAGAICSIAFNQPTPILDGNVIRVLTRIFGIGENPREKKTNARLWELASDLVGRAVPSPPRRSRDTTPYHSFLNQSLMELGAMICAPRNPQCRVCPVKRLCVAFRENRVEELPNLGRRQQVSTHHFVALVVERNGRFLVRQRPAGVVNAHLWEFPNVEVVSNQNSSGRESAHYSSGRNQSRLTSAATPVRPGIIRVAREFGLKSHQANPLCTIKHSITRYRITLDAFRVQLKKAPRRVDGVWRTPAQLDRLAFTAAHKKLASFAARRILSG
jgi:A/G-specific adenine glycosylase